MKTRKQRKGAALAARRVGSSLLGLPYSLTRASFLKALDNPKLPEELAARGLMVDYQALAQALKDLFPPAKPVPDFGLPGKQGRSEPICPPMADEFCPGYYHPTDGDVIEIHDSRGQSWFLTPYFFEQRLGDPYTIRGIRRADLAGYFKYRHNQPLAMFDEHLKPKDVTPVFLGKATMYVGRSLFGTEATRVIMAWALRTDETKR